MNNTEKTPIFNYNQLDDDDFRMVIRSWIAENYPDEIRHPPKRLHFCDNKIWYRKLSEQGWLAPNWPVEYGGLNLSPSKLLIMHEEQARYGCARLNDVGLTYIGPLLIKHGTDIQRQFHLPKILSGEHVWCQGYSEPDAGSDLASLSTRAEFRDDMWVVNGQKIWTTLANDANWIFLLARTDTDARKQDGISFFLIPMESPGITVRPIINLDMHDEFCEVFFDNVRVSRENIIGEVNKGWHMAKTLLNFERIFLGYPQPSSYALNRLKLLAKKMRVADSSKFRDAYIRLRMDLDDHQDLYESFLVRIKAGEELGPEVSTLKLNQCELYQRITEYTLEIAGEYSGFLDPLDDTDFLHPAGLFIQSRPLTIAGGSSEIQREIISKQVLGMSSR